MLGRSSKSLTRAAVPWLRSRAHPSYNSPSSSPPLLHFARLLSQFHPSVQSTLSQLNAFQLPRFGLPENSIDVMTAPSEFYDCLKSKIKTAKTRIFLASLYIGKNEKDLVQCLEQALFQNPDLKVYILVDALRGTREAPEGPCAASLLAPLVKTFGVRRVTVSMYHTPELHGLAKLVVPKRFNEGWGLQHMKLYGFDDEIILSGANLSHDYFTDRQDRYMLFRSKELTDYYFKLHQAVSSISYKVIPYVKPKQIFNEKPPFWQKYLPDRPDPTFKLIWDPSFLIPEPTRDPRGFISVASEILRPLLKSQTPLDPSISDEIMTYVYPVSQLSPLFPEGEDASTEFPVIDRLLSMLTLNHFNWVFTAGYFNMHPHFRTKLLESSPPGAVVVAAAPEANGFYKSKGISGLLPGAYSLLASKFLQQVKATSDARTRNSHIELVEWRRGTVNTPGGWSYHAKGLWIFEPSRFVREYKYTPAEKPISAVEQVSEQVTKQVAKLSQKLKGEKEEEEKEGSEKNEVTSVPKFIPGEPRSMFQLETDETLRSPVVTVIGSSNYTRRAYAHDLEANAIVVTRDRGLQAQLRTEVVQILSHAREVSIAEYESREPTLVLRTLTWFLGGKL
ncbi:uncharacterized protein SAPINGB_P006225 [Magnusiomyces paraingens]|uniref:CDP-diacylglycerol--glycerol-3-phosphate 3-phosphatidyltransferase n=1 Tax=Magnusiomyces paraingens TaxID=2606893 RepID=A0A5E8C519_9ASCO|nr:uncharacterized protein SAPINGB_P006225 [Saprochaete ingens]VVT58472.1 unnamed protein product [Saprochaete ingens]